MNFFKIIIIAGIMSIAACTGLTAISPSQKLAAGYTLSKTISESTDQLYLNHQLSKANGLNIKATNDVALTGLDVVGQMQANGDVGADAKLLATIAILTALQDQLNKQKVLVPATPASGVK